MMYPYLQMDATYDDADRLNLTYDYRNKRGPVQAVHVQGYATRVDHSMTDELRQTSVGMARAYSMATTATTATEGMKAEATLLGRDGWRGGVSPRVERRDRAGHDEVPAAVLHPRRHDDLRRRVRGVSRGASATP